MASILTKHNLDDYGGTDFLSASCKVQEAKRGSHEVLQKTVSDILGVVDIDTDHQYVGMCL